MAKSNPISTVKNRPNSIKVFTNITKEDNLMLSAKCVSPKNYLPRFMSICPKFRQIDINLGK